MTVSTPDPADPTDRPSAAFMGLGAGLGASIGAALAVTTGDWRLAPVVLSVAMTLSGVATWWSRR